MRYRTTISTLICLSLAGVTPAQPGIHVNQIAFDGAGPKRAVVRTDNALPAGAEFTVVTHSSGAEVFRAALHDAGTLDEWGSGKRYYHADFSALRDNGTFRVQVRQNAVGYASQPFEILDNGLARRTVPWIVRFYKKQRADTPQELEADRQVKLWGSNRTVDMRGGWCDASGDVSKYFSHLAYANHMSPQQTPLVAWSLIDAAERIPELLDAAGLLDSIRLEALWGADYMMRALSEEDYFYMIIFSYFNPDPSARRVVGLLANSVTTADYQSAFREGGGMAIAALARISQWQRNGDFTARQYREGAQRAFAHLLAHNRDYCDDGTENIIDDYCALMAATELWIATDSSLYRDHARMRAANLAGRLHPDGYFICNDANRPFWHASDAGLPVISLVRYLDKEDDPVRRGQALATIRSALDYHLQVSNETSNPFGYARQHFLFENQVRSGFFIPHDNETGWWWQGENARLGSLAAAAIAGGRLVYPGETWGVNDALAGFAHDQINWITGRNPYDLCFIYGLGVNNVPYMSSSFGHGSNKGGISNGITGAKSRNDGGGIDFRTEDNGNEWRWTEQWIPHAAWFLQAMALISEPPAATLVQTGKPAGRMHTGLTTRRIGKKLAISWQTPYAHDINLAVYTPNGRLACRIPVAAGSCTVHLDAGRLGAGAYQVVMGTRTQTILLTVR